MLNKATILITGGTGSFGKAFVKYVLENYDPQKIIIYSRDEYKQFEMQTEFIKYKSKLRFFIGDVRDKERLFRAFEGVDYVIHAAAMKHVHACEYNPIEAVKTNIIGAENIIEASIEKRVKKVVALSTDKAVNPVNLYGATKLVSDKLFIAANAYVGDKDINFSVVRYGNVAGSRGSVIPIFAKCISEGKDVLTLTDERMTRFWIGMEQAIELVILALNKANGGETYISKIPSFNIIDLARAMAPDAKIQIIGIQEGEKLHECMITEEDSLNTYEFKDYYIIYPQMKWNSKQNSIPLGVKVQEGFAYTSGNNSTWLTVGDIREKLIPINKLE
ncbi:MAG TPA: UDP-N-acetylglucosamine 4,6-dehydratase (inverting) [Sedimentibacter sp.]|nr:UDP-N-acetylglucosamine 4,6-dehydratase (inverting) [Sedimentibacter sp.]